jgi:hypothetical protein
MGIWSARADSFVLIHYFHVYDFIGTLRCHSALFASMRHLLFNPQLSRRSQEMRIVQNFPLQVDR